MWLVAVLWCYVVGCEHCEGCSSSNLHSAHTLNAASQNRYQPHPALPAQTPYAVIHGFVLLMMGIKDARNMLRQCYFTAPQLCSSLAWRWPFTIETCSRNVTWLYILYHCTDILLRTDSIQYIIETKFVDRLSYRTWKVENHMITFKHNTKRSSHWYTYSSLHCYTWTETQFVQSEKKCELRSLYTSNTTQL